MKAGCNTSCLPGGTAWVMGAKWENELVKILKNVSSRLGLNRWWKQCLIKIQWVQITVFILHYITPDSPYIQVTVFLIHINHSMFRFCWFLFNYNPYFGWKIAW